MDVGTAGMMLTIKLHLLRQIEEKPRSQRQLEALAAKKARRDEAVAAAKEAAAKMAADEAAAERAAVANVGVDPEVEVVSGPPRHDIEIDENDIGEKDIDGLVEVLGRLFEDSQVVLEEDGDLAVSEDRGVFGVWEKVGIDVMDPSLDPFEKVAEASALPPFSISEFGDGEDAVDDIDAFLSSL
jgi:hypothetical protein